MKPGPLNLITDVPGIVVGSAENTLIKTGVTVLSAEQPLVASVDVMGGAPGTRETDLLAPDKLVDTVDALVLSGGSAYGLDSASGVMQALDQTGRGYPVGSTRVPIVPAAVIFDLFAGGENLQYASKHHDLYRKLGRQAFERCSQNFALGSHGAGTGATTANLKGGLGSASLVLDSGFSIGALVVVNPHGSAASPSSGKFWASPFEFASEFGGLGAVAAAEGLDIGHMQKGATADPKANTTLAIIATDAKLDKAQLQRLAVSAHDGMARALVPSHTFFDGDIVFSVSTGHKPLQESIQLPMLLGHAASVCLARAIARGVYHAQPAKDDIFPCWSQQWGADL